MDLRPLRGLRQVTVLIIPLTMLLGCGAAASSGQPIAQPAQADVRATDIPLPTPSPVEPLASPSQSAASVAISPAPIQTPESDEPVTSSQAEPTDIPVGETAVPASSPQPLPSSEGMVKIEGGDYMFGGTKPDASHVEFLTQYMALATYWIDVYEVTNAAYQVFLDQTGHAPPATWPGKPDHPVQGVTWDDAAAFCSWLYKRLLREAEWEAAARGPGPNPPLYPWGDDENAGGQIDDLPRTQTYAVGAFAFNKSPAGVFDMAGNVWEWVSDPYAPEREGVRILRGGRFGLIVDMAFRQSVEPDNKRFIPFAGLRCAADKVQGG